MQHIETGHLITPQKEQLRQLWNREYPASLAYTAEGFDEYLNALQQAHHYLLISQDEIQGWCFTFLRDGQTWFAIILDENLQGKGLGQKLINALQQKHHELHGWVIDHNKAIKANGEAYRSPLAFYQKQHFKIEPGLRIENEKLSAVKIVWQRSI